MSHSSTDNTAVPTTLQSQTLWSQWSLGVKNLTPHGVHLAVSIILGSRLEKSLKPWHTVGTYFLFLSTNHVTKSCSLKRQYNESWIWVKIFKLATVKCTVRYTAGTLALPSKSKVKVLNYPKPHINIPLKAAKSDGVFSI